MIDKIIQSVGTIIKEEKLASVEDETSSKYLILESLLPYPGYHGTTIPDYFDPESFFVVTKTIYSDEKVIRSIQKVKEIYSRPFDAAPGNIILKNSSVNIIRFKGLGYNMIAEVIEHFSDIGIEFEKKKKVVPYNSLIKVRKFFRLNKLSDGIYEDMDGERFFYLRVPGYIEWGLFEELTKNIRYNIGDIVFDAAQTSVYDSHGLVDFVRIYKKDKDISKLSSIKSSYLSAFEKLA